MSRWDADSGAMYVPLPAPEGCVLMLHRNPRTREMEFYRVRPYVSCAVQSAARAVERKVELAVFDPVSWTS